jgi:hypothetical protein
VNEDANLLARFCLGNSKKSRTILKVGKTKTQEILEIEKRNE